jgi:hypothetical protein
MARRSADVETRDDAKDLHSYSDECFVSDE